MHFHPYSARTLPQKMIQNHARHSIDSSVLYMAIPCHGHTGALYCPCFTCSLLHLSLLYLLGQKYLSPVSHSERGEWDRLYKGLPTGQQGRKILGCRKLKRPNVVVGPLFQNQQGCKEREMVGRKKLSLQYDLNGLGESLYTKVRPKGRLLVLGDSNNMLRQSLGNITKFKNYFHSLIHFFTNLN